MLVLGCVLRTGSDNARVRSHVVATNYPFVKLMEIAESVPTGRVRQRVRALFSSDKRQFFFFFFYNFTRALQRQIAMAYVEVFKVNTFSLKIYMYIIYVLYI